MEKGEASGKIDVNEKEKPMGKIGIGPEGRPAAVIQFVISAIISIGIFVYALSPATAVLIILPATLIMLICLGLLVLVGDSFPYAPPGGNWTPAASRFPVGVKMTLIWAVFTAVFLLFMAYVYPKWPMSPLYLWWGAIGFWCTLLYGINWNTWPFKGRMHPWLTMLAALIVVLIVSSLVWNFLTNLAGTPLADSPMDHKGPLNVNWLTGYIVWFIGWFFVFSPVFTTQGWPFRKWGHPGAAVGQTILSAILGLICWNGSLAMGLSPTFSFAAVGSSLILWSLVYGWHFQFWGITHLTGGSRAIAAFVVQCVLIAIWIVILKAILGPYAEMVASLKLPADVNILIIYVNLCIAGPILIAHNAFWLRWPLTLPTPPGTPPPDQSV
jgi:hypothetical protein